jgi:hypothetical protein
LHRLALELRQLSPILPEKYVPFIFRELKLINVNQMQRVYKFGTVLSTMASEAAVAKRNTAVLRQQTKIVALSQDSFSQQQIGLSPTHLHRQRQRLPPHHLLHQPNKSRQAQTTKA